MSGPSPPAILVAMPDRVALLIEDDRLTAAVVSDWLTEAGWRVVHVERGGDALPRFAEVRPTLVLCDLVLPGVDGTTLCSNLRLQPFGERVTILLTSARTEAAEAAMAAGADAFLPKPIRREELFAAVDRRRGDAPPPARGAAPPVRVPTAPVLGAGPAPESEEGALGPGVLVPMLRRLHAARFNGVLEASGSTADGPLRAKIFFHRGCPAAARSNDSSTEFGRVLERLGLLSPTHLADSVDEGRRTGLPLGEVLLRSRMVDRQAVERALREQVLLRTVGIGLLREGTYVLSHAEALGLAGFDVHPDAVEWRLGGRTAGFTDDALLDHHVRVGLSAAAWALFDPAGELGLLRALVAGGATARDCLRIGGLQASALLGLLQSWDLAALTDDAVVPTHVEPHAEAGADGLTARIHAQHRALSDANHYIVFGVRPDSDAEGISIATVSALAAALPDSLPTGLDADTLRRARAVYERVLEAGRILGDTARRAIYDARLAGDAQLRSGEIDRESHAVLQAERTRELFRKGEFVTAAALFGHAMVLEGEAADILAMLGWARHRACPEDPTAGEAELRRALGLDAEDEFALYYLGRLLVARGEKDEARRLLRAAVAQNHEFEQARDALRDIDAGSGDS